MKTLYVQWMSKILCIILLCTAKTYCALPALLELNDQLTEISDDSALINQFLLTDAINSLAPDLKALQEVEGTLEVGLKQFIVVWQSLTNGMIRGDEMDLALGLGRHNGYESENAIKGLINIIKEANVSYINTLASMKLSTHTNIGGGGGSCGYHALRNLQACHELFNGAIKQQVKFKDCMIWLDLESVNRLFSINVPHGKWRKIILDVSQKPEKKVYGPFANQEGDWLTYAGVGELLKDAISHKCKHIIHVAGNGAPGDKSFQDDIRKLTNNYGVLVHKKEHWYLAFVVQNESMRPSIYIFDSKNEPRYTDVTIRLILEVLSKKTNDISQALKSLEPKVDTVKKIKEWRLEQVRSWQNDPSEILVQRVRRLFDENPTVPEVELLVKAKNYENVKAEYPHFIWDCVVMPLVNGGKTDIEIEKIAKISLTLENQASLKTIREGLQTSIATLK